MAFKGKFFGAVNKTKFASALGKKKGELGAWIPGTAGNTTSTVEISMSCHNLPNKDLLSKSDPLIAVFHRPPGSKKWSALCRTETISDDLNPEFEKKIVMEYRFEQVQLLRFEVYDIDFESDKLGRQDLLGFLDVTLGQIVSAGDEGLTMELSITTVNTDPTKPSGTITLTAEEVGSEKDEVTLKLAGTACGIWRACIPPKTYFAVYRMNDAGRTLCNGDPDRELRIDVYQKRFRMGITHVGSTLTTLSKLQRAQEKLELMTSTGESSKASVRVVSCTMAPIDTFLDYLNGGTQLQCVFAIDFTCSNGDPSDLQSLHCTSNPNKAPNPYEQAIQAVGNVLKDYDTSGSFPAYGFGARIPPNGEISYNFPLTLSNNHNCNNVIGILEQYRHCLAKCQLFGPTYFAPVIRDVSTLASKVKNGEKYYVLVILTDGVITDMAKTKKAIVDASGLPMSIVIIGLGEVDFDLMEELDGDAVRLSYRENPFFNAGKKALRDIVQFVAYRNARSWMTATGEQTAADFVLPDIDYAYEEPTEAEPGPEGGENPEGEPPPVPPTPEVQSPPPVIERVASIDSIDMRETAAERKARLGQSQFAQEILAEIPDQVVAYMTLKGITPSMISAKSGKTDDGDEELTGEGAHY